MNWKVILTLLAVCTGLGLYLYTLDWGQDTAQKKIERDYLLPYSPGQIEALRITFFDTTYSMRRKSYEWEMVDPFPGEMADSMTVNHVLNVLAKIFAFSKLPADSLDLSMVYLDQPVLEIAARTRGGDSTLLQFGALNPTTDNIYVMRNTEDKVLLIGKDVGPMLGLNSFMLRGKGLTNLDPYDISQIRYEGRGDRTFSAGRSPQDGSWWLESAGEKLKGDKRKIISFLSDLYENQVRTFEPHGSASPSQTGLTGPQRRLWLSDEKGDTTVIILGNTEAGSAFLRWSYSSLYPENLLLTDSRLLQRIDTNFSNDWMLDLQLADFEESQVNRIELSSPLDSLVIVADDDTLWRLVRPKEARARLSQVERIITHADTMAAVKVMAPAPGRGFDRPQISLTLKNGDQVLFDVIFGDYGGEKEIYVRDRIRNQDFLVPAKEAEDFEYSFEDLADMPVIQVVK